MNLNELSQISGNILTSLGGGGIIVFALSGWLGKVWANRLMAKETKLHNEDIAKFKDQLQTTADCYAHNYRNKIELYKEALTPIIEFVIKMHGSNKPTQEEINKIESTRFATTALLGMFATAAIFDEYNGIIDYLYDAFEDKQVWSFPEIRNKTLSFLSLVRKDIGLYVDDLHYTGTR